MLHSGGELSVVLYIQNRLMPPLNCICFIYIVGHFSQLTDGDDENLNKLNVDRRDINVASECLPDKEVEYGCQVW